MARRRGLGASSTACDEQLAPGFDDPDAPVDDGLTEAGRRIAKAWGIENYHLASFPVDDPAQGRKFDHDKPRFDLLVEGMPRALEEVAMVLTFGSQKYADHNWQHVDRAAQRYLAAGMRHELALATGETHDPETGAHHLAHKLCCDLFRLELALRDEEVTCR
ncbi:hypothetical protein SAMN04487957_110115 [Halomonas shengliensis]|uniref:dATP/dGTP diphosphohydrolase N-terminal domain-containing protein n=1 Tax=Halomonas shengliensis TaxID=419597 RepID=A0A1H0LUW2_9GAMM|nr:dATP/dGTP diphosphohydrolase domain-containing protein [Halomonas shengliensis]SDO71944.1 hypothetical protein SAMN04487957_110115 [Halomonas shengliensis]